VARGHQLFKDGRKLARDLLERPLDRLVLLLVEMLDERLDRLLRCVELLAPLQELVTLRREAVVLVERLLVDVLVLLEGFIDLAQPRLDLRRLAGFQTYDIGVVTNLLRLHLLVLAKGLFR
jgi:hypothetical protein